MRRYFPILFASLAAACGGSSPTGPGPTPTPGYPVSGYVFYDENANGIADPSEIVRLPGVTVSIGGRTAVTTTGGRFTVEDVPGGQQSALATTLPAYFTPGVPQSISVPAGADVAIPALLPLGGRARPNVYLAFGDSISWGEGSSNLGGYRADLQSSLRTYWGKATVENAGDPGTKSDDGQERLAGVLASYRPAYLLILYGTNDWNYPPCRDQFPCYTIDNLRAMVHQARGAGAEPILGTIPPVNPAWLDHNPTARNAWVKKMDVEIRAMAQQERVPVAQIFDDFEKEPNLSALFYDDKHPNEAGYRIMARSFFNAITQPYGSSSASSQPGFFTFDRRR
jgi:lysophospholipase L1-like esterase